MKNVRGFRESPKSYNRRENRRIVSDGHLQLLEDREDERKRVEKELELIEWDEYQTFTFDDEYDPVFDYMMDLEDQCEREDWLEAHRHDEFYSDPSNFV